MATTLTPFEMKQRVADHFEDFVNRRNASVIHKNMTPDFYDHDGPGGRPTDAAGDEQMMLKMYDALPGLRLSIEEMIAEGDKVVCPQHLALDRRRQWKKDAVSRLRSLALRRRADCGKVGNRDATCRGRFLDEGQR